ncbi:hypothetical protein A3G63_01270 [Candidatus Kaiserbacteria bacterium RIFCSPLOWO2_12_FULL_52_8]|uniref:Uncharacterized protein n=1 Tax=Candidatus Kaiserbacteria bacterium RIFCSPHIGHO2_01_FULL_53_31 TaxID=1798481 RepID=A0A1F6CJU9_9BACT|nr:MAG: hypothetical protein A2678_00575 [Candidatus Kaiserbacteria bacterium RIFCSPHIGHO2_01_FULL_53_31]OGG94470.1 MAG: hypothetical protein A3G63_01270 [Candidatus Kaiserbacteria bacterium RIFCSPLOWO2_12_FULL_52_8]
MQDELTSLIANDLGIADIPADKQKELIGQFGEVALKAATLALLDKLSDGGRTEFMKLAERGDAEALKTYLDREVPSHEEIAKHAVAEEVKRFKAFKAT